MWTIRVTRWVEGNWADEERGKSKQKKKVEIIEIAEGGRWEGDM